MRISATNKPSILEQQPQKRPIVCVVGGSIAGVATAAALKRIAGYEDVCVVEKRRSPSETEDQSLGSAAAAVQLGPNGLRALRAIGGDELLHQVLLHASILQGNIMYPPPPGGVAKKYFYTPRTTAATSSDNLPEIMIRWDVLHSLLSAVLPPNSINTEVGHSLAGYRVCCSSQQEEGEEAQHMVELIDVAHQPISIPNHKNQFSLVIAADGIHSLFRYLVQNYQTSSANPHSACHDSIKDLGRINYKAVVPLELSEYITPDHFRNNTTYCYFPPHSGIACFAGPAGSGYSYWAVSQVDTASNKEAEERTSSSSSSSSREEDETTLHLGWGAKKSHQSLVAMKQNLLDTLTNLNSPPEWDFMVSIIQKTDASSILKIRSEEVPIVGNYSLVSTDGYVVLVGDAAHAMSASYGQAVSFALEDAATLAVCMRDYSHPDEALSEYSQRRVNRCLEMQQQAADRAAKQLQGEKTNDISSWIYEWTI